MNFTNFTTTCALLLSNCRWSLNLLSSFKNYLIVYTFCNILTWCTHPLCALIALLKNSILGMQFDYLDHKHSCTSVTQILFTVKTGYELITFLQQIFPSHYLILQREKSLVQFPPSPDILRSKHFSLHKHFLINWDCDRFHTQLQIKMRL